MLIYAHRGASAAEPENTLAAFRLALELGVDGVELDVWATRDGVPVVLHDRSLERTTNGTGNVDELTLAELRAFDAGGGQPVPTFDEVLALLAGRAQLDVEVKQAGIEREIIAVLDRHPALDWAVSAFDWDVLRAFRALAPAARLLPLADAADDALFAAAAELGSPGVALYAPALTAASAARFAAADLGVIVWVVNDLAETRRVQSLGAAGLCTDDPATILAGLRATAD